MREDNIVAALLGALNRGAINTNDLFNLLDGGHIPLQQYVQVIRDYEPPSVSQPYIFNYPYAGTATEVITSSTGYSQVVEK